MPATDRVRADFDAVAIGIVENPTADLLDTDEGQGWSATARITEMVEGRSGETLFTIGRNGDSASCDDGQGMPKAGERWVVYLRRHSEQGRMYVDESYPLSFAQEADPRFRR